MKICTICFNQNIDIENVNKSSIVVNDLDGNEIQTELETGFTDKELRVLPPKEGYDVTKQYTLTVKKDVLLDSSKQIKNEKQINFKIKKDMKEPVSFKDYIIDGNIRLQLGKSDYDIIYKSEVENITNLAINISKCNISDLSGIENLTNLKVLYLSKCEISDISPLKNLTNLKSLSLWKNNIRDITPLKQLKNLDFLAISANNITNQDIILLQNELPKCTIE